VHVGPQTNQPVVPVIINQPIDTAAINAAVRRAVQSELANLRPLLDSLRNARVEVVRVDTNALISRYVVPIHFDFDSAVVREVDLAILGQVAEVIRRAYPNALVTIEGFADPAGSRDYNMRDDLPLQPAGGAVPHDRLRRAVRAASIAGRAPRGSRCRGESTRHLHHRRDAALLIAGG